MNEIVTLDDSKHPNVYFTKSSSTDAMFALVTENVPWCNTFWQKGLVTRRVQFRTKNGGRGRVFCLPMFFTHNIFLKEYEAHVVFKSEHQFQSDYRRVCTNFTNSKLISSSEPEYFHGISRLLFLNFFLRGKEK